MSDQPLSRAQLAEQALLWSLIAVEAKAQAETCRAALDEQAREEYERQGSAPTWRFPGVGTVPLSLTTDQVVVDNPVTYLAWMRDRGPHQIETVEQVRPAFDKQFRESVAKYGDPPRDPATGELVPGLRFVPGGRPKGVSVRPADGAKQRMTAMAREALGLPPLPDVQEPATAAWRVT